jgi:hypothetical protein
MSGVLHLLSFKDILSLHLSNPSSFNFEPPNMRLLPLVLTLLIFSGSYGLASSKPQHYNGEFCAGEGDTSFLRLIDESFAFFNSNPALPNLAMVYKPEWDTFVEGAGWDAWWIQNSYGFSYAATPFLREPWFSTLQRSWDLHWNNQGDGKRMSMWGGSPTGAWFSHLVAPDGSLGDMARPGEIGFKQGDGDQNIHDWFYEAAAAGLVMQAEILLASRDMKAIRYYLPKMERACNFIEKTRDPKNNLFLVGPASNLLAPSFGGIKQPDGSVGKGYLTGLSITYLAALHRMIELYKLAGIKEQLALFKEREKITRESLPLLMTPKGYFAKSVETGGIKHGVLGQERFDYLEGVANADAVALRVVDDKTARTIYNQIAGFPEIRPFDFLLTNAPRLDDSYWSGGSIPGQGTEEFRQFGHWVDGGAWGTVEGRAILMYYRLGRFEDIRRSAIRAMKWAKDFRMDAPWSQQGENTKNPWSDTGEHHVGGVSLMIDNFAIPAATIRGLFDYEYRSDRLILRPRVPGSIKYYSQKQSIRFGEKRIYLSCHNDGPRVKSVTVNGTPLALTSGEEVILMFSKLPMNARVEIITEGKWPEEPSTVEYPAVPALLSGQAMQADASLGLPQHLWKPYEVLQEMRKQLAREANADIERAFVAEAIRSFEGCALRAGMDPGPGYYRTMTQERKETILKFFENAALNMYNGFAARMASYSKTRDPKQQRLAALFDKALMLNGLETHPPREMSPGPAGKSDSQNTYVVSVTFGKSFTYSPVSNEAFHWDGSLRVQRGELNWIDKLLYARTDWSRGWSGCSREYARRLTKPEWKSEIVPGSGNGTEGIRFSFKGDSSTQITIATLSRTISFQLGELLEKEMLEYHCGGYYSGQPIVVFLGQDPRIRVTRQSHLAGLREKNLAGAIVMPDDFAGRKAHFLSTYCTAIPASGESGARFDIQNFDHFKNDTCVVHLQLMGAVDSITTLEVMDDWMELQVSINDFHTGLRRFFSKFRMNQKIEDLYVSVPRRFLVEKDNEIHIRNLSGRYTLLAHRIFVNDPPPSLKENLRRLPPLPRKPNFWIGFDENTLTPQNGEVDDVLTMMGEEEVGNYILFRIEEAHTLDTTKDFQRWCDKMVRYNMKAGLVGTTDPGRTADAILKERLGKNYLGIHGHERSNLIYGWGDPDPIERRANRTLPECEAAYLRRVGGMEILGQALPIAHLDYKAGVQLVFSEPPTGHSTLMFASQRGAVYAYDKDLWGVHNANHVPRVPADSTTERRNFILLWQAWLYGARLIYDEEFALYAVHDAPRAYNDPFTLTRRKQMQELYHYASAIDLGKEDVRTGFLQGNYDCLVGGLQSDPDVPRTKFWGMIGPEKPCWEFNTPERGWELLGTFMPGVWLYPVLQDPTMIRQFFGGSPYGQVDLVPIDEKLDKMSKYQLLVLPGWNTMTDEIYAQLIAYVRNGGHLVLSAAQCTKHVTRDFLTKKKDFQWYADGDLTALAGVKLNSVGEEMRKIVWAGGSSCAAEHVPGLDVSTTSARVLASDEKGRPVFVENTIGTGKVWMLTVGEYWGAPALDPFRSLLMQKLTSTLRIGMRITGESNDVDWHVYDCTGGWKRIVFLNTDWTGARNSKRVFLETGQLKIPLDVVEGGVKHVLVKEGTALAFTTPGMIVTPLESGSGKLSLKVSGVGETVLNIESSRIIAGISLDDRVIAPPSHGYIIVNFGERWKEMTLEVILR